MEPKNNSFLVTLLSILLLLSCIIAGFFAWQTQNLVKELQEVRRQELVTPSPTATPDPTADWKTYKYLDLFEIKIPNNYKVVDKGNGYITIGDYISISSSGMNPEECKGDCYISGPQPTKIVNGVNMKYATGWWGEIGGNIAQNFITYIVPSKNLYTLIQLQELPFDAKYVAGRKLENIPPERVIEFDQIISTFKFIESQANSSPVACTMEAKICPDGSVVGRIGPNCEFAPCPTPKT